MTFKEIIQNEARWHNAKQNMRERLSYTKSNILNLRIVRFMIQKGKINKIREAKHSQAE